MRSLTLARLMLSLLLLAAGRYGSAALPPDAAATGGLISDSLTDRGVCAASPWSGAARQGFVPGADRTSEPKRAEARVPGRVIGPRPAGEAAAAVTVEGHEFAGADYSQGKVFLVGRDGRIGWEHPAPGCNDLWVLANGNLLFNTGHGVQEVTREHRVVFEYQSKSEIYACQRLPNGNTFVGECNAGRLLEIEAGGRIAKEIRLLPEGRDGGHLYMRNARQLTNGHYVVTHYGEQVVREYRADGTPFLEIPATGGPHSAVRLPDGHTLITCGDLPGGSRVFEADAQGKVVWQVQGDDLPGISLKFVAGVQRLPNGNTVIANWLGHGQFGQAPHLLEITPDKRVVWRHGDHLNLRTVSTVQILDRPADPVRGEVWH